MGATRLRPARAALAALVPQPAEMSKSQNALKNFYSVNPRLNLQLSKA